MRRLSVLAALSVLLLAACGGGGGTGPGLTDVAAAADQTAEAGTARVALTQTIGGLPSGDITVEGEGAIDFDAQRGRLTVDLAALTEQAPAGAFGGGSLETIFDGTTIYLMLPLPQMPTPWVKIDLTELEGLEGLANVNQFSNDPSDTLQLLRGASDDVEVVGEDEVRGASTTHYRATVSLDRAIEQAPEDAEAFLRQQRELLGVEQFPVDAWVDDEGRLRRLSYAIDLSQAQLPTGATAAGDGSVAITLEYYDFGEPVDVKVPPADQVTDLQTLLQQAPGAGAGGATPAPTASGTPG
jgi:hypothetical protein